MFKKGQKVVKVISVLNRKTASLATIASVSKGRAMCEGDKSLVYNAHTGEEINPSIPGCFSELIALES